MATPSQQRVMGGSAIKRVVEHQTFHILRILGRVSSRPVSSRRPSREINARGAAPRLNSLHGVTDIGYGIRRADQRRRLVRGYPSRPAGLITHIPADRGYTPESRLTPELQPKSRL